MTNPPFDRTLLSDQQRATIIAYRERVGREISRAEIVWVLLDADPTLTLRTAARLAESLECGDAIGLTR